MRVSGGRDVRRGAGGSILLRAMCDRVRVQYRRAARAVRGVCRRGHLRRRAVGGDMQRAVSGGLLLPREHCRDAVCRGYLQQHNRRYVGFDMPGMHRCGRVLLRGSQHVSEQWRLPCGLLLHGRWRE